MALHVLSTTTTCCCANVEMDDNIFSIPTLPRKKKPGLVNSSAEGDAWFVKIEISNSDEVSSLMNEADYKEHCEKEAH